MTTLNTPVREATWAALDFESSGSSPEQSDEPVQVGMASWRIADGFLGDFFRSYIRPAGSITQAANAVHYIDADDVKNAPTMLALWPEFKKRLTGAAVVAHGAGTEKRFLRIFPMHGFDPWVDTLAISRALLPDLSDHALGSVIAALGLEGEVQVLCPQLRWHDALFDAVACLVLLRHLINCLHLENYTVGQLSQLDATAYHRQRAFQRLIKGTPFENRS